MLYFPWEVVFHFLACHNHFFWLSEAVINLMYIGKPNKYIFYFTVSNIRKFRLDFLGKYLDLFLKKSWNRWMLLCFEVLLNFHYNIRFLSHMFPLESFVLENGCFIKLVLYTTIFIHFLLSSYCISHPIIFWEGFFS